VRRGPLPRAARAGFEVAVVKDATAAAQHPELGDGYATALTNFGFIANAVLTTDEAVASIAETSAVTA
jgi:nicotinamidase-related amidase